MLLRKRLNSLVNIRFVALLPISLKKKFCVRFLWRQHSPEHYHLLLTNFLGNTEVDLDVQKNGARLIDRQSTHYFGDNAEEMIYGLTGIALPLNNLKEWMLGLPGLSNDITLDERYHLSRLIYKQDGLEWIVSYQDYYSTMTPSLPNRMEIHQGNTRIKLKIDSWGFK